MGGGRRDRDARDARGRGGHQDLRRLDRPRRVPARVGERLPDDDATWRRGRPGLHARARRSAVRDPARPDPRLHRAQGRHERQHPGHPRHRGQDRRPAGRAVRLARRCHRARGRAVAGALEVDRGQRRAGRGLEAPRDHAPRPRARRRHRRSRLTSSRSLAAEGDLPTVRVPLAARARRHARRGAAGCGAPAGGVGAGRVARGRAAHARRPHRGRRRRRPNRRRDRGRGRGFHATRSRRRSWERAWSWPRTTRRHYGYPSRSRTTRCSRRT